MYKLTYALSKVGNYETFEEAFVELYNRLMKDMEGPGMSWQLLETAIWIEEPDLIGPTMFYEARDKACKMGLLKDGQLNPNYKGRRFKMEEYNWKGVKVTVTCPECHSENVEPVHPFDYVKECKDCGHQFSTGVHN